MLSAAFRPMSKSTYMRRLRFKYGISARELSDIAGVSPQYIIGLELGEYAGRYDYRRRGEPMIRNAFEGAAANRMAQAQRLSEDLAKYSERLLDFVEDNYEL